MKLSKRTIKAVFYNLAVPGSGYFYIGARDRYLLGGFLVYFTIVELFRTWENLVKGNNELHLFSILPLIPGPTFVSLAAILMAIMTWNTYRLSRKIPPKPNSLNINFAQIRAIINFIVRKIARSSKRTKIAMILNLALPGLGYLYIRARQRYLVAGSLLSITTFVIIRTVMQINGHAPQFKGTFSPQFIILILLPGLIFFVIMIAVDTFRLSRRPTPQKR